VSGVRRAFLDRSPGEERAVVTLDGRPERLLIVREGDALPRLGAQYLGRVEATSERLGLARLDLGATPGTLRLRSGRSVHVGQKLRLEVVAEPVRDKPAVLRPLPDSAGAGALGLLAPAPSPKEVLRAEGIEELIEGEAARELADEAEAMAVADTFMLPGGLDLAVQVTRALTAVDVDLAEGAMPVGRANPEALRQAARLLRLKAIGGLVIVDLVGFPKDGRALQETARAAFAPDGPGVSVLPPSRLGLMEIAKPHARQPVAEQLLDASARPSARTLAQRTVRDLAQQGRHSPGALLTARRAPEVAALAAPFVARLGPRFRVEGDPGATRESTDILSR
jgi:hypothetical protein